MGPARPGDSGRAAAIMERDPESSRRTVERASNSSHDAAADKRLHPTVRAASLRSAARPAGEPQAVGPAEPERRAERAPLHLSQAGAATSLEIVRAGSSSFAPAACWIPQLTPEIWTDSVPSTSSGSHRLRPALPGRPAGCAIYSRDRGVAPASPRSPAGFAASQIWAAACTRTLLPGQPRARGQGGSASPAKITGVVPGPSGGIPRRPVIARHLTLRLAHLDCPQ